MTTREPEIDLSMTSDHDGIGEDDDGREWLIPAGTTVTYVATGFRGSVRVRLPDGTVVARVDPRCFPTLRAEVQR